MQEFFNTVGPQMADINYTVYPYKQASEALVKLRQTHLDQLTDKLSERRTHRVISAILAFNASDTAML